MSDIEPADSGGPADMQMAVAALLANNKDVKTLLKVLAKTLQETLGDRVEVVHATAGILHHPTEEIRTITVHLDQDDYQASMDSPTVRCGVGRSSGGIRIRNEQVPVEQWLKRLLSALQEEAVINQSAQAALQNVIIGGTE